MLILGSLVTENGYVFHRSDTDFFIVETTLPNDEDEVSHQYLSIKDGFVYTYKLKKLLS